MFSARTTRLLVAGSKHGTRWAKRQRALSTTVNPAYEPDSNILRHDLDIHIPEMSLPEVIWANLDKWADKTATEILASLESSESSTQQITNKTGRATLPTRGKEWRKTLLSPSFVPGKQVCNDTGRSYTYAEHRKLSNNLAKALRVILKLQPGNTIAILLPNVPEYSISLLGIIEGGMIATTVNPVYKSEEIARQLVDSNAKVMITLGEYHTRAVEALQEAKLSIPIITVKTTQAESTPTGAIDFGEFSSRETEFNGLQPGHPDDVILLPYSSGTTGLPKGVELTHRNIVSNLMQCVELPKIMAETTKDNQDVIPAVLPMFHIYGMTVNALKALQRGCKALTLSKFTPDIYTEMLVQHKPQHLFLVPPIVIFLAAHSSVTKKHLDSVKSLLSGAAPLGASDVERLFQKTGKEILSIQGYGMTETSPVICMTPPEIWKDCLGAIGPVIPNTEIKVVAIDDPNGTPLGSNEQGEIWVRGPQVMPRYHNNQKATDEVFHNGWLKTGDMAYYDNKKILWITDRLKELIKVKGFQVAPAELEAVVRDHPDIADAAVIGIPHPIYGEVPKAFVVPKTNAKINVEQIQDYVAKKVASYKRLEGGVTILDAIPKNASGKIMRRTLKLEYADK